MPQNPIPAKPPTMILSVRFVDAEGNPYDSSRWKRIYLVWDGQRIDLAFFSNPSVLIPLGTDQLTAPPAPILLPLTVTSGELHFEGDPQPGFPAPVLVLPLIVSSYGDATNPIGIQARLNNLGYLPLAQLTGVLAPSDMDGVARFCQANSLALPGGSTVDAAVSARLADAHDTFTGPLEAP